jgi:hypothetical protein
MSAVAAQVYRQAPRVQKQIFDCTKKNCSLKEFKVQHYRVRSNFKGSYSYSTSATMSFQTHKIDQLEDYAIVQFIKGCQYNSFVENGVVKKLLGISREYFDNYRKFKHSKWMIDSIDKDPMYNNMQPEHRHGAYRWNNTPGRYTEEGEHYLLHARALHPEIYVSDLPGMAFASPEFNEAKNISLKIKSCLYKTEDLPLEVQPDEINFAKPISCFDWQSSHIYNHQKGKYESNNRIDSFCLEP